MSENKRIINVRYPKFNPMEDNPYQEEMDGLLDIAITEANITRSIKNINECLTKSLKSKYGIKDKEELKKAVNDILAIHGMSSSHFDPLATISKLTFGNEKNVNNISVDDNANKTSINMEGICGEAFLPYKKVAGYDYLYQTLKELYGKEEAKKCCASMYDLSLALNDSTKIMIPYCYCIDASKLVLVGRSFGQVHSSPAKRISTYVSVLCDTIREISFNIAGACLHHSQGLIMQDNGNLVYKNIKELVNSTSLPMTYSNYQGEWEYADVSDKDLKVMEDGKFVKVNKIMRRKYDGDIYEITTKSGKKVKCSKDHKFKVLFKGRDIEVKAEDLQLYDTVYNTMLTTELPINKNSKDYKRGQFIGMLCGDGCITNPCETRLAVHKDQMYINDAYTSFVKENYDKDVTLTDDKRSPIYDARFCSVDAHNDICKDIIGDTALNKHIDIKDKSVDYLVGFLDGLFVTDGYYNNSIGISSISEKLIKNVYDICHMLNIKTSEILNREDTRPNRKSVFSINVSLKVFNYLDLMQNKAKSNKKFVGKRIEEIAYFGCNAFSHSRGLSTGNKVKTYKEREINIHSPTTDVIIDIQKMDNDDEYVYEIETESHWYSVGGLLTHNCAIGSFFLDIAHLAIYKERITLDDLKSDKKTRKYITNCLQQFIHSVNHYSRNAVESPFTNVSCFDRVKLANLIGDENYGWYFPKKASIVEDNEIKDTKEAYKDFVLDYIEELQEMFIDIFDEGDPLRNGLQFPFPVTTINLGIKVNENGERELEDKNNRLLDYITSKDISKYNIYCSEGTKVASCCLASTTKVLARVDGYVKYLTVAQLFDIWDVSQNDKVIEIMGDNGFVKVVKGYKLDNPNNTLNKITLENGCVISTTLDHPSVKIEDGKIIELKSEELKVGDIIPVSKNIQYDCLNGGSFELGRYVGLFGAEGMFDRRRDNVIYFCFNTNEKEYQQFIKDFSLKNFGADSTLEVSSTYENSSRVRVMSRAAYGLVRDFFVGDLCIEKRLTSKIFNMSEDFRKGFLTGFIEGDGYTANSDRSDYGSIHINNKELARDIVALANSINIKCSLRIRPTSQTINILHNDKMKLDVLKDWHDGNGSEQKSTVLNDFGNHYGIKIESIEQIKTKKNCSVYDFTVDSDNHLFQIANGIITHNCRLINDAEMMSLGEGVNSFGGSQISLGSHRVVTINFARCALEAQSYDDFKKIVTERIEEMAKILKAHRVLIHKLEKLGCQPWISNGWINMSHMFSTFGCCGYVEADKFLKAKFNHADYDYMKDFLVYFNDECKRIAGEMKMIWNIEAIPAEGMAPKLAKADAIIFGDEDGNYNF